MGEARFNGLHSSSNAKRINAQNIQAAGNFGYSHVDPLSFSSSIELEDILGLQSRHILLAPSQQPQPSINVAAIVQQAVNQDPTGSSLHGSTLRRLQQAPADHREFGI